MAVALACLMASYALAERASIVIDGLFDDWANISPAYSDIEGEVAPGQVDFLNLWLADDEDFLFCRLETVEEFDPSENNQVVLYIDADDNPSTGLAVGGIGAEVEWRLGARGGIVYLGDGSIVTFRYRNIRFRGAPTDDASEFEFAIGRNEIIADAGFRIRILWVDEGSGDRLPGEGETVSYTFDQGDALPPLNLLSFERDLPNDLRVATYNVLFDNLFNPNAQPGFQRQLQAVEPDIISFQEIYDHSVSATVDLVSQWLSLPEGETWHGAGRFVPNNDTIIVSRFPILNTWQLFGSNTTTGNLAALIDTESALSRKLLLIDAHLPSGSNDFSRQQEIDQIMAFIRDAKEEGGALTMEPETPIMITGDLNLVGRSRQLRNLLDGDILDEGRFGPDVIPDWDGTDFADLIARHSDAPMGYTWRSDGGSGGFWPGHLDFIIYSDSVLEAGNHFIVYTPEMPAQRLAQYGLQIIDSFSSDHMMLVGDFRIPVADALGGTDFATAPGWRRSPWYGTYFAASYPWIYHQEHGWQWIAPNSEEGSVFLFDDGFGQWLFTNAGVYRFLYVFDPAGEETWMWSYPDNTPELRYFFNYRTGEIFSIPSQI